MSLQKFNTIMRYFKIFALSVFFLIKCNFLFAQKDLTDSAKTYEYWSKRGIIEVVYAYMNDYITTVTDSSLPKEKIKDCTKEKTGFKEYEKKFVSPLDSWKVEVIPSKLNELSVYLKNNNWVDAENNVLQPLISNLNSKKPLNHDFFSTLKPTESSTVIPGYTNKMNNWEITVERIISEYNDALKEFSSNREPPIVTKTDIVKTKKLDNRATIKTEKNNSINWFVLLLTGILSFVIGGIIAFSFFRTKLISIFDENDSLERKIKEYKNKEKFHIRRIEELEKKIPPPNKSNIKPIRENTETEILSDKAEYLDKSIEWDLSKEGGNKSVSYFSIPEYDGRFIIDKGEQTNDGSKYYKIEYLNNSDEGDLFYISGIQDKRAINRLDSYLKTVCDIDDIMNADNAVKIELIKSGKVIRIGESWVIDPAQMVKIKLI